MRRLFGGLVAAQSVVVAYRTLPGESEDERSALHSLHAYFLRPGRYDLPIRMVVDRIRDGRTYTTRRVVAHQGGALVACGGLWIDAPKRQARLAWGMVAREAHGQGIGRALTRARLQMAVSTPNIDSIVVVRMGRVRRAKLYYLRERRGKSARITERSRASRNAMEAKAAVSKHPLGSNWLEKTDCAEMEPVWAKYSKKK